VAQGRKERTKAEAGTAAKGEKTMAQKRDDVEQMLGSVDSTGKRKEAGREKRGEPRAEESAAETAGEFGAVERSSDSRLRKGRSLCKKYMLASMAAGLVPAPAFDIAAVTAVQLKMLHSLSRVYEIPFSEQAGKSAVASLLGGVGATSIARGTFGSIVKAIPVVGTIAGAVTMPIIAAAATYAIGRVFLQHFEAGGTLLDFDPEKVRNYFSKLYREGEAIAKDLQKKDE